MGHNVVCSHALHAADSEAQIIHCAWRAMFLTPCKPLYAATPPIPFGLSCAIRSCLFNRSHKDGRLQKGSGFTAQAQARRRSRHPLTLHSIQAARKGNWSFKMTRFEGRHPRSLKRLCPISSPLKITCPFRQPDLIHTDVGAPSLSPTCALASRSAHTLDLWPGARAAKDRNCGCKPQHHPNRVRSATEGVARHTS